MSAGYYAFALFVTGLICVIAIICKLLFANVRKQYKILDEKETKLLRLYQSVESLMEDFNDQAKATVDEIREYGSRNSIGAAFIAPPILEHGEKGFLQPEGPMRAERGGSNRLKAANEVLARAEKMAKSNTAKAPAVSAKNDKNEVFQRLFEEAAMQPATDDSETPSKQARSEAILTLAEEGKTDAQIASELGITQNEVRLIIELSKRD